MLFSFDRHFHWNTVIGKIQVWQDVGGRCALTCPNKEAAVTQGPSRCAGSLQSQIPEEKAPTEEQLRLNSTKPWPAPALLCGWLPSALLLWWWKLMKGFSSAQSAFSSPRSSKSRETWHWVIWSTYRRVEASNTQRPENSPWDSELLCIMTEKLKKKKKRLDPIAWTILKTPVHYSANTTSASPVSGLRTERTKTDFSLDPSVFPSLRHRGSRSPWPCGGWWLRLKLPLCLEWAHDAGRGRSVWRRVCTQPWPMASSCFLITCKVSDV